MSSPQLKKTNRLSREKSPYLLQHQHNPVDWYPWGEEAFGLARDRNCPIFLSIGYSTCHWCHVMERESFEDEVTAAFLNKHFVCIKVDREERPDLDKIYMTAVQSMIGQGGWPLNCVLTPDLKPFFGGTYFPPEPRHGRPAFLDMLGEIERVWRERQGDVQAAANEIVERLKTGNGTLDDGFSPDASILLRAASLFMSGYDGEHGGFGGAPKFPCPSIPLFLLHYGVRLGDPEAITMVKTTCDRMASGGICDQLGGGFHRYSVDAQWLVPHFEKMLYDNAQLVELYLDVFLYTQEERYAKVVRHVLDYVLRDMTHPEGGFYSAEDADSDGKEGLFYCWTQAELAKVLTPAELGLVIRRFGITEDGNFMDHSDPDAPRGLNILSLEDSRLDSSEEKTWFEVRSKLLHVRGQRVRPHRDDKVLSSWNGMMLGAMARAAVVLDEPAYLVAAEKNFAFIKHHLWSESDKTLFHRWREGERDSVQLLDAYANQLAGVLALYEVTLKETYLKFAVDVAESMIKRFYDAGGGGFYQSEKLAADLILAVKPDYDGAEPSGNSVAALALLKLSDMMDRDDFRQAGLSVLALQYERVQSMPQAVPHLLLAWDYALAEPRRVTIFGDATQPLWEELLRSVHSVYQPNKVVLDSRGNGHADMTVKQAGAAHPQVGICTGATCHAPVTKREDILALLSINPVSRMG